MREAGLPADGISKSALRNEIARLNKVNRALMDRVERTNSVRSADFSPFQTEIQLEEQVRRRTAELETLLHENEKTNQSLRESESKFHGMVSQSLVGIGIIENGKFSYTNAKFNEMFGYEPEEIERLVPLDIVFEPDRPLVTEQIRKRMSGEVTEVDYVFRGLRKDGAVIDIEIHGGSMEVDGGRAVIGVLLDVTKRIQAEREVLALQEELRDQSLHDALTGLYNRRYLEEALKQELISAARHGQPVSVIMADLDHFKTVNDRQGHTASDEVLRTCGDLLRRRARGSDICCRYGGEEFLLILPQMAKGKAVERAEQLRRAIAAATVPWGRSGISMTASFGVASYPGDGTTDRDLIAAADRALYMAKSAGRNRVIASADPVDGGQ